MAFLRGFGPVDLEKQREDELGSRKTVRQLTRCRLLTRATVGVEGEMSRHLVDDPFVCSLNEIEMSCRSAMMSRKCSPLATSRERCGGALWSVPGRGS